MTGEAWLRRAGLLAGVFVLLAGRPAEAQEEVHFPSLDDKATMLDGYLFRPAGEGMAPAAGRHPALVFLHGCAGLFFHGKIGPRESDWAKRFNDMGYVVLMVDSFRPRDHGEMCSQSGFELSLYLTRPKDAYGALRYLQAQPFVKPDRIGVIGWSQGGGTVLFSIRKESLGRPAALPQGDFRVAVAFYPAACRESAHKTPWTSEIPLLILVGEKDNWTPAGPCQAFAAGAAARGSPIELKIYPSAYHDFDWPDEPLAELTRFRMRSGEVPIAGTNPAARADALARVPQFLARYLDN